MKEPIKFTTRNNQAVSIRRLQADDVALLIEMFHHLSERTRQLRFNASIGNLSKERLWERATELCELDPTREVALVATIQKDKTEYAIGVSRFSRQTATATEAEWAVVVRDDFQQTGVGTQLILHLVHVARSMKIKHLSAWVVAENRHILNIIKKLGLPYEQKTSSGQTEILIYIDEIDKLQAML